MTIANRTIDSEPGEHIISRLTAVFAHAQAAEIGDKSAALLFDLDGTLVDSEPMNHAAFRAYFASLGWPYLP
ncbi:MAG: hypothetical protein Q4Q03_07775, partial [Bowdeniella nasicola]|nr:hypothetical protein [Bowdeniella nasicola]